MLIRMSVSQPSNPARLFRSTYIVFVGVVYIESVKVVRSMSPVFSFSFLLMDTAQYVQPLKVLITVLHGMVP